MSFTDIFKSNFLSSVTTVTIPTMVIAMLLAFCLGMFIFFVYKKTFSGVIILPVLGDFSGINTDYYTCNSCCHK